MMSTPGDLRVGHEIVGIELGRGDHRRRLRKRRGWSREVGNGAVLSREQVRNLAETMVHIVGGQ